MKSTERILKLCVANASATTSFKTNLLDVCLGDVLLAAYLFWTARKARLLSTETEHVRKIVTIEWEAIILLKWQDNCEGPMTIAREDQMSVHLKENVDVSDYFVTSRFQW
jgi:hypothetical protein